MSPVEYDLVLANINRNIIIEYRDLFHKFMKADGALILSGLLRRDEVMVVQSFRDAGYTLITKNAQKEWLLLVLAPPEKAEEHESGY